MLSWNRNRVRDTSTIIKKCLKGQVVVDGTINSQKRQELAHSKDMQLTTELMQPQDVDLTSKQSKFQTTNSKTQSDQWKHTEVWLLLTDVPRRIAGALGGNSATNVTTRGYLMPMPLRSATSLVAVQRRVRTECSTTLRTSPHLSSGHARLWKSSLIVYQTVWFTLSQWLFPVGWYGEERLEAIPRSARNALKSLLMNDAPRSLCK